MIRQEQCDKVCRILDNVLANRPTERDSLNVAVRKAFETLEQAETNCSEIPNNCPAADVVPVVRCKDCKFREEDAFCTGRGFPCQLVPDDGFCDKGKKQKLQYADEIWRRMR
jgi:hypothetical protein